MFVFLGISSEYLRGIMITQDLFETVLTTPASKGCDTLLVVSGYASPSMVYRHFNEVASNIKVHLIVGKIISDGISVGQHKGFCQLCNDVYSDRFECRYFIDKLAGVHSKSYLWLKKGKPTCGFVGSANYSQNAFCGAQEEILSEDDPRELSAYYNHIKSGSVLCNDNDITTKIKIKDDVDVVRGIRGNNGSVSPASWMLEGREYVILSLLSTRTGETPSRSGINWGQRAGRNHDQAYLAIPTSIQVSGFFPSRPMRFMIHTDDGVILDCTRAQAGGKGIQTYTDNSILGRYLRARIGVPGGVFVTTQNLRDYGRTNVTIYKIDDENYYMNFSV